MNGHPRVAFDVGPLVGRRTGIGQAVAAMLDALERLEDGPTIERYVLSARAELAPGVRRLPYPAAVAHRLWSRMSIPRADRPLGRPDLIHGTNYVVPPARCPRIVTVYDCWFLLHPDRVHPDVARAGAVLRRSIAEGAIVHASSEATAGLVRELFDAPKVVAIPLGALPLDPPPSGTGRPSQLPDGRPYLLALGTVERRKNLPHLVRSFALAAGELGDHHLVIAGAPGDDSAALETALAAVPAGVRRRIVVLGWIDDATRSWLLHNAAALAYPSLDEGFGFPLLEAMAAATPVVASTAGSIPEISGTAAVLVGPDDESALADALVSVVTDDTLRLRLIAAGTARVTLYSWRTTAERLAHLYHEASMGTGTG